MASRGQRGSAICAALWLASLSCAPLAKAHAAKPLSLTPTFVAVTTGQAADYLVGTAVGSGWPTLTRGPNPSWPKATVRSLQYLLNAQGADLGVDGVFGPLTDAAVRSFQTAHGLAADGTVAGQSWPALITGLSRGMSGQAVRAVQDQLNSRGARLAVDGIFGSLTQRSLFSFQHAVGLGVDGIVGPVTWRKLLSGAVPPIAIKNKLRPANPVAPGLVVITNTELPNVSSLTLRVGDMLDFRLVPTGSRPDGSPVLWPQPFSIDPTILHPVTASNCVYPTSCASFVAAKAGSTFVAVDGPGGIICFPGSQHCAGVTASMGRIPVTVVPN